MKLSKLTSALCMGFIFLIAGPLSAEEGTLCEPAGTIPTTCGLDGNVEPETSIAGIPWPTGLAGSSGSAQLLAVDAESRGAPTSNAGVTPCNGQCPSSVFICGLGDGNPHSRYRELEVYYPGGTRYSHFAFTLDTTGQQVLNGAVPEVTFFSMNFQNNLTAPASYSLIELKSVRNANGVMSVVVQETQSNALDVDVTSTLADYVVPADEGLLIGTATVTGNLGYVYVMTTGGTMLASYGNVPYSNLPPVIQVIGTPQLSPVYRPKTIRYGLVGVGAFTDMEDPVSLLSFLGFWKFLYDDPSGLGLGNGAIRISAN